jgi:hypothetical protein
LPCMRQGCRIARAEPAPRLLHRLPLLTLTREINPQGRSCGPAP